MLLHYGVKGMKWKDHNYVEPQVSEEEFNTLKEIMSGTYKGPMDAVEREAFVERVGYAVSSTTGNTFMSMSNKEILDELKKGGAMSKSTKDLDPKAIADGKSKVDDILKKKGSKKLKDGEDKEKKEKGGGGGKKGGDPEKEAAALKKKEDALKRKEEQEAKKIEALKIREEKAAILKERLEKREALQKAQEAALEARRKAAQKRADEIAEKMKKYSNTGLKKGI